MMSSRLLKPALALGLLALSALPSAAQQINMLCAPAGDWCEAIAAAFERDTGIKVGMARKSAGEILAQIKAEAQNPKTDIWFGGSAETHMVAAEQGVLQAYTSPNMKDLHPWAQKVHEQSGGQAVGVSSGAIALVINKELAAKKGFKLPDDWDGLLDPAFRNEVQMPNPASSGTAYTIIAGLIQLWDEERAFAYLKKLHANINAYARSGAAPLRSDPSGRARAPRPHRAAVPRAGPRYPTADHLGNPRRRGHGGSRPHPPLGGPPPRRGPGAAHRRRRHHRQLSPRRRGGASDHRRRPRLRRPEQCRPRAQYRRAGSAHLGRAGRRGPAGRRHRHHRRHRP